MKLKLLSLASILIVNAIANQEFENISDDDINSNRAVSQDATPIKLNSPILPIVDGIKGLMDADNVHKIIFMYQRIKIFQHGNVDRDKKTYIPQHIFKNQQFSLIDLIKIESEKLNSSDKKELDTLLHKLKEDFLNLARPFQRDARGTKKQMYELIKTFCNQRKRSDSLLLDWGNSDDDESFRRKVISFKILNSFCNDLIMFYGDLLHSCPKATQQFKEKFRNNKNSTDTQLTTKKN